MACNTCSNDDRENQIQRVRGRISRDQLLAENFRSRMTAIDRAASVHPVFWPINMENAQVLVAGGVKIIGKTDKATWPVLVHGAISTLGLFRSLGGAQDADTALDFRLQINDTGATERTWASEPVPESLLTGQARRWEGNSVIADHFESVRYPVPVLVGSGNRLVLNLQNDGANSGYTRGYFNFLGMHVYEYAANQGKLDVQTRKRAAEYIRSDIGAQQRFIIIALTVDFTGDTKNLQFPTYYDDLLVLGFASNLWYSTVEIKDPYDVNWTSNPTQVQAVCSYAPAFPEISRFRMLIEPQFLPRATSLTLNVAKQTAVGASVVEDGDTIWMLAKTI
jgi:hypothetical protein